MFFVFLFLIRGWHTNIKHLGQCLFLYFHSWFKKFLWIPRQPKESPKQITELYTFSEYPQKALWIIRWSKNNLCYSSVMGEEKLFCWFPQWLMTCDLFSYLIGSLLGLQSLFIYLPRWKCLGIQMFFLCQILLCFPHATFYLSKA